MGFVDGRFELQYFKSNVQSMPPLKMVSRDLWFTELFLLSCERRLAEKKLEGYSFCSQYDQSILTE